MIELRSLVKNFTLGEETITAVNHVELEVKRGEFIAVVGPSGSGKSTLMTIIGLLDRADEGTYLFDGQDVTQLTDDEQAEIRNKKIGFVFQSFHLLQNLSAVENVMVPLLYGGAGESRAREAAAGILERIGMGNRKEHLPNQLSGGQQQRVAIARALVGEPELILADEPTGALDQNTGREIMKLLLELNEEGQTIILITHDLGIAQQAKRIVYIEDGVLREENVQ
ncbi:MAG: ABC transporter ATP-binding protein [Clostridia bacterium]|nr:ABC transporter ATP-binding protein [Clostridia bacterium]